MCPVYLSDFSPDSDSIAIGVLTSNRGGGQRTTLADWTWHQGAIAGCSGRGAIAGAIVGCHCSAMVGGEGDDQLWGSGQGAHGTLRSNGIQKKRPEKLP